MSQTTVAVCVATYLRPEKLSDLLESLRAIRIDGLDVQIIVADNDPVGSASTVVEEYARNFPFPVKYVVEPKRGIASVRNRLFEEAFETGVEFIATIDDDATADSCWLRKLVSTALAYDADVVGGPQLFWMDDDVPQQYRELYRPVPRVTGSKLRRVSTCNALFRCSAVRLVEGPFDTRFNLTGGEDGYLSVQLAGMDRRIVECAEAIVHEHVPKSRLNVNYQLKRRFAAGANQSRIMMWSSPSVVGLGKQAIRSIMLITVGLARLIGSVFVGRERALVHAAMMMTGIGGLSALLAPGYRYRPYSAVH